jgi:hypothetical protein
LARPPTRCGVAVGVVCTAVVAIGWCPGPHDNVDDSSSEESAATAERGAIRGQMRALAGAAWH